MKYKILEVHPFDAWYNDRNEIIGEVFDLQGVEKWGDDEIAGDGSSLKGFVMAFGYYAIKVEPQDLSALLARVAELEAALKEARHEIKVQFMQRFGTDDFESAGCHNEVVKKIEALLDGDK